MAGNGRSQRVQEPAPPAEVAQAVEGDVIPGVGGPIPGTSLVMHRFGAREDALGHMPWINASGMPNSEIAQERMLREIAVAVSTWNEDVKLRPYGGSPSIFDRNRYVAPNSIFDQMRMARLAVEDDDVVGGAADSSESLAIDGVHFESEELDDANVFNQWSEQVDFTGYAAAAWRSLFTDSQVVTATWWGIRDFRIEGRTPPKVETQPDGTQKVTLGNKRKAKKEHVYCPLAFSVLDGTKAIPVGNFMFGQEMLAWRATREEMDAWQKIADYASGDGVPGSVDATMQRLFLRKYTPGQEERVRLGNLGIDADSLLLFNPDYAFRHTLTRPSYQPWASVRLKRALRFLDLKQQLLSADRTSLIGTANYILLIKKGEKDAPASTEELAQLNANFQWVARIPVIIGDHTLSIEIITPKTEFTLQSERYAVLQSQITHTVWTSFRADVRNERGDTTVTLARAIAKGIQSRRNALGRHWKEKLIVATTQHPLNAGKFQSDPDPAFTPRNISLDIDQQTMVALTAAHAVGDVSRRTFLEELGLDEDIEFIRRLEEREYYDDGFKSAVPFNAPGNNPFAPDPGPGNNGGGALPPGQGGGGKPPAGSRKRAKKAAQPTQPAGAK